MRVVESDGFEPTTSCVQSRRSPKLSYDPEFCAKALIVIANARKTLLKSKMEKRQALVKRACAQARFWASRSRRGRGFGKGKSRVRAGDKIAKQAKKPYNARRFKENASERAPRAN